MHAGPEAIGYCLKHSESKVVFVSAKNWAALVETLPSLKDQIHTVIYWGADRVNAQVLLKMTCSAGVCTKNRNVSIPGSSS